MLAVVLAAAALVLVPGPAVACSCAGLALPEQAGRADNIGVGTVAWVTTNAETTLLTVDFTDVLKGRLGEQEKVRTATSQASCGLDAEAGRRYLFFVRGEHGGRLATDLCSGTAPYARDRADQVRALVDGPGELVPAKDADIVQRKEWFPPWVRWGLAGVALLVLAGMVAFAPKGARRF